MEDVSTLDSGESATYLVAIFARSFGILISSLGFLAAKVRTLKHPDPTTSREAAYAGEVGPLA